MQVIRSARSWLYQSELFWFDNREWLEEKGYVLRPRYQRDWVPSYERVSEMPLKEDGQLWIRSHLMDAEKKTSESSSNVDAKSRFVVLKRLRAGSEELNITTELCGPNNPKQNHPLNHCVPVLDVISRYLPAYLPRPEHPEWTIVVLPLLRQVDDPKLRTVGEAVELFRQMFQGLKFIHDQNIAHRDCGKVNVMMDATPLYTTDWHPVKQGRKRDWTGPIRPSYTRTQKPVKYYFIDFGYSKQYSTHTGVKEIPSVHAGGDETVPEYLRQKRALRSLQNRRLPRWQSYPTRLRDGTA
ncbi:Protein kinase domain-containing protein [Mycena chlorophos]|uniref:Protein kinase domain-containing protein n=1 Tax=Mycena chlorophos TaxID=658473 RepID=A0A8H6SBC5_MYCCL|nr:Protein kinase domain-containing protein [Mycena chlorophos]